MCVRVYSVLAIYTAMYTYRDVDTHQHAETCALNIDIGGGNCQLWGTHHIIFRLIRAGASVRLWRVSGRLRRHTAAPAAQNTLRSRSPPQAFVKRGVVPMIRLVGNAFFWTAFYGHVWPNRVFKIPATH